MTQIGICADLLDRGKLVDALSLPITVAAVLSVPVLVASGWLSWVWTLFAVVVAAIGVLEKLLALRTGFDATLLRRFEQTPDTLDSSLSEFDAAMTALGAMPESKTGRPISIRLSGCMRLLRWQVIAASAQLAVVLVGAPVLGLLM